MPSKFTISSYRPGNFNYSLNEIDDFISYKSCPCCKSKKISQIFTIGNSLKKINLSICDKCCHVFYSNFASENFIDNFYQSFFSKSKIYKNKEVTKIKPSSKLYNSIQHLKLSKNSKIIDIGCGHGSELLFLKEKGFTNLYGSEMNNARVTNAKINFPRTIFNGGYKNIPSIKFDIIYSNHSLEHIVNLNSYFKKMNTITKKDSLVIVNVPNSLHENIFYQILYIGHVHSFTPESLKNLGRIHGFHSIFLKPTRKDEIKIIFSKNRKKLSDFKIFNHQKYDISFFKNRFSRPFNITSKKSFFTDDRSGVYSNYNDIERRKRTYMKLSKYDQLISLILKFFYEISRKKKIVLFQQIFTFLLYRLSGKRILHFGFYKLINQDKGSLKFPIKLNDNKNPLVLLK